MDKSQNFDNPNFGEEIILINEIDKRVLVAADFLKGLDNLSRLVTVDDRGKILVADENKPTIGGDLWFSTQQDELINRFQTGNAACVKDYQKDPAVIDARVVNGCVVVMYDSSRGLPIGFLPSADRGDYEGPSSFWTKNESGNAVQLNRLGLITIDLNKDKRGDGVNATTSLQHEL